MMTGRARAHPSEIVPGPGLGGGNPGSSLFLRVTECRNCPGAFTGHPSGLCGDCREGVTDSEGGEQR